jgi:hypothetical protein
MRTLDRTLMIVLSALIGASVAAGCGGDGDGGGGDVSTGIAPNKLLSDITDDEAESACERLKAGYDRVFDENKVIRAFCTIGAATSAANPSECASLRDECIESASQAGSETTDALEGIGEFTCEDSDTSELNQCTGTVAQLETCFNDILDTFEALLNQFSCDDAPIDEASLEGFGVTESPASCEAVGCPEGSPFAPTEEEEEEL